MLERYDTFTVLIASLHRCIRKIKTEKMSEFNLKSTHLSCLYYIYNAESMTAKELCDICKEDKGLISRALDYLEENGFIICEHTDHKKYKSQLTLTEKGFDVAEKATQMIYETIYSASEGVEPKDREIMYQSLGKINENLKSLCSKCE